MSAKGEELLLRARQQFRDTRTVNTLKSIDVPEWGTKVYYWEHMSVDEARAVGHYMELRRPDGDGADDTMEMHLTLGHILQCSMANLIHRGRDEGGTLLFNDAHAAALRSDVDEAVIKRIGTEMGFTRPTLEDAEKN